MAPTGLPRLLLAKYWLASVASLIITLGLITLSCHMLSMPPERTLYFAGAVTIMTFTLNGLATGLGALYPNFRDDHPGKIVSGFGGTFCLTLSFLYVVVSVMLLALSSPWGWGQAEPARPFVVIGSWAGFGLLSLALGYVPLRLGLRRVADLEV
jgi:ABC-2 type transport system permease protein